MSIDGLLVGCGEHARTVLVPVLQLCGVRLVAVCDTDPAAAEALAGIIGARPYTDLADALASHRLPVGIVAVPPMAHAGLVRRLVEGGLAVFVEKPGGYSTWELSETLALSRQRGAVVQVGFMRRYAPAYRILRSLLRSTSHASVQIRAAVGMAGGEEFFLKDVGVHLFDLVRFLVGDVRSVDVAVDQDQDGAPTWQALFSCVRGTATLLLSSAPGWGAPSEHAFAVAGTHSIEVTNMVEIIQSGAGRVSMADDVARRFEAVTARLWRPNLTSPRLMNHTLYLEGYVGEIDAFVRASSIGGPSTPDLGDALAAMALAEEFLSASQLRCAP
ncbi:MAG: Gfo/Idh/MocA family protein [Acidimicrobiia bacterium]